MPKAVLEASVIIPAYNSASTIGDCIKALAEQDFARRDFEIIVVDDGSKDGTGKISRGAGAKVISQDNAGPAKARNRGAKSTSGEILVFTDADCVPQKNWLREMLEPFKSMEIAGVQGAYKTRQKSLTARFGQIEIEERYERMKKRAQSLDWIGSYSAAYRKKDFFEAGGFDESFPKASGEDPELSYKMQKSGKKLVFNQDAIVYHTHPDTMWKYLRTKYYRAFYRVNLYSKHKDKIASDSYTPGDLKLQVFMAFAGTGAFIAGFAFSQPVLLAASLALGVVGFLSTYRLTLFALKKDFWAGLFSIPLIQLRNSAFMLGLIAGFVKHKVL